MRRHVLGVYYRAAVLLREFGFASFLQLWRGRHGRVRLHLLPLRVAWREGGAGSGCRSASALGGHRRRRMAAPFYLFFFRVAAVL